MEFVLRITPCTQHYVWGRYLAEASSGLLSGGDILQQLLAY